MNTAESFDPQAAIGMRWADATQWFRDRGYKMRIMRRDGQPCLGSRDYRADRINVSVSHGKVDEILSIG